MHVQVRLFATLRRHVQGARYGVPFQVELAEGATLADLFAHLNLPPQEIKMAFVNGRARPEDWPLAHEDQVGIFPPVGGG